MTNEEKQPDTITLSRAEFEAVKASLKAHHKWHSEIGEVLFIPEEGQDPTELINIDLSAEYGDSSLYGQTLKALAILTKHGEKS